MIHAETLTRTPEEVRVEEKFKRAGHRNPAEHPRCDHSQYNSTEHGHYCPCGTAMWDAGD